MLEYLTQWINTAALCALGQGSCNPVVTTLRHFRDEYEAHVRDKFCPAGVCKGMFHYEILEDVCNGCGACRLKCPEKAIAGDKKVAHKIDLSHLHRLRRLLQALQVQGHRHPARTHTQERPEGRAREPGTAASHAEAVNAAHAAQAKGGEEK